MYVLLKIGILWNHQSVFLHPPNKNPGPTSNQRDLGTRFPPSTSWDLFEISPTFLRYQFLKLITADGNVLRASSSLESVGLGDGDAVTVTWLGLFEETDGEATEKTWNPHKKVTFSRGPKKLWNKSDVLLKHWEVGSSFYCKSGLDGTK